MVGALAVVLLVVVGAGFWLLFNISAPAFRAPNVEVGRVVSEWSLVDDSHGPATDDNETLRSRYVPDAGFEVEIKKATSYRFIPEMDSVRDMRVEADLEFRSPVQQGAYPPSAGVICRAFPAEWFFFRIWTSGHVAIFRIRGESAVHWLRVPAETPTIPVTGVLHLRADCVGGNGSPISLTLDVNGTRVLTAHDNVPGHLAAPGRAGWMIDTGYSPPVVVRYRNFIVHGLRVVS